MPKREPANRHSQVASPQACKLQTDEARRLEKSHRESASVAAELRRPATMRSQPGLKRPGLPARGRSRVTRHANVVRQFGAVLRDIEMSREMKMSRGIFMSFDMLKMS